MLYHPEHTAVSSSSMKRILFATLFVAANTLLPQFFHLFNLGGSSWLPILLFTVVGTIAFGTKCGIAVGVLSPIVSMLLFGMPSGAMCLILMVKGATLAAVLGAFSRKTGPSLLHLLIAIAAYQLAGILVASALFGTNAAFEAVRISYPGVMLQVAAGYLTLRLTQKENASRGMHR